MIPFEPSFEGSLQDLQNTLRSYLAENGVEADRFEARQLIKQAFSLNDIQCLLESKTRCHCFVTPEQWQRLQQMAIRRAKGEPLQYIMGQWEFWGRSFTVGPGVLIPRADTETLIEAALDYAKDLPVSPVCIDLCAGSGCISITLACELKTVHPRVIAVEWSEQAIDYLKKNIAEHEAKVELWHKDVLDSKTFSQLPSCHLLLSNPPYLRKEELMDLSREVKWEPQMALNGGEDGLIFYRSIVSFAPSVLRPGGVLLFEVGAEQSQQVLSLMEAVGFTEQRIYKDSSGFSRVVAGKIPI